MKLYSENNEYKLYQGNMLEMMEYIKPNSIDSIITDPPYGLTSMVKRFGKDNSAPVKDTKGGAFARLDKGFMGKEWDGSGIEYNIETWQKCYEVLKPGGYLLAFGGSRTFHRIACAIEDAGFEIRDTIMWLYGSGFPKSMSLSKGLEAREKLGNAGTRNKRKIEQACNTEEYTLKQTNNGAMGEIIETTRKEYIPNTELAKQWQGWGTALKPSFEPIIVARKPFKGSLVDNVIEYGVGGLNIDECRVGNTSADTYDLEKRQISKATGSDDDGHFLDQLHNQDMKHGVTNLGRFPANTILTYDETDFEEVCAGFPDTKSVKETPNANHTFKGNKDAFTWGYKMRVGSGYDDNGSAARYFYCAKASKKDRDEGCDTLNDGLLRRMRPDKDDSNPTGLNKEGRFAPVVRKNTHPTVKPTELMQYLIRLVTPEGGIVLDPFNGSGSTGKAAMYENKERHKNYKYVGIELTEEYLPIAKARIEYVCNKVEENDKQMTIFDLMEE